MPPAPLLRDGRLPPEREGWVRSGDMVGRIAVGEVNISGCIAYVQQVSLKRQSSRATRHFKTSFPGF